MDSNIQRPVGAPKKDRLKFFSFDTDFFNDPKIEYLEAEYPITGPYLFIRILTRIYSHSYFLEWGEKYTKIFSRRCGIDYDVCNKIINVCINEGLFNHNLYDEYLILTSRSIQDRWLKANYRRKHVEMDERYILIDPSDDETYPRPKIKGEKYHVKVINAYINKDNARNKEDNVDPVHTLTPQTKLNETKLNKIKLNKTTTTLTKERTRAKQFEDWASTRTNLLNSMRPGQNQEWWSWLNNYKKIIEILESGASDASMHSFFCTHRVFADDVAAMYTTAKVRIKKNTKNPIIDEDSWRSGIVRSLTGQSTNGHNDPSEILKSSLKYFDKKLEVTCNQFDDISAFQDSEKVG